MDFNGYTSESDQLHGSEDTNKVAKLERRRDRLSELPDSLTLLILSYLELGDVVRTTILSKFWKDRWTAIPHLCFWEQNPTFIEGVLAKWNGANILTFHIAFLRDYPREFLDSCLLFPIERGVQSLKINFQCLDPVPEYSAPQRLYSCSSITRLMLDNCTLKIDENVNVQWNQLKYLRIGGKNRLSEGALNRILSGAPLLEELLLLRWNVGENINIQSTSLKMITIRIFFTHYRSVEDLEGNPSILTIRAPNLLALEISGLGQTKCLLDVPSLTSATLRFDSLHYVYNMSHKPSRAALFEDLLRQPFLSLSHVQNLALDECAIKFLVDEMKKDNYVFFPKVVMLIIDHYPCNDSFGDRSDSLAPKLIKPSLLQLKTIVIPLGVRDYSGFVFIEFLLENARALEKMVLHLGQHQVCAEEFNLGLEKVLSMRRSSPYAKVIISRDRDWLLRNLLRS